MPTTLSADVLAQLQASFLALVLPRVLDHGRVYFRAVQCPQRRQDAIHDMIGLAWQWHLRLAERGSDATAFPTALASYAARAVNRGSRLAGQERTNDVLSSVAQRRHHFFVARLPEFETLSDHPVCEALHANTQLPPDQIVCFKLDFLAWLARLSTRDRGIALALMIGERTRDVANQYKVSPARISQKRREFQRDWLLFQDDDSSTPLSKRAAIA